MLFYYCETGKKDIKLTHVVKCAEKLLWVPTSGYTINSTDTMRPPRRKKKNYDVGVYVRVCIYNTVCIYIFYPLYSRLRGFLLLRAKRTAMHLTDEFGNLKGQKQKGCLGSRSNSTFSFPVSGFCSRKKFLPAGPQPTRRMP